MYNAHITIQTFLFKVNPHIHELMDENTLCFKNRFKIDFKGTIC